MDIFARDARAMAKMRERVPLTAYDHSRRALISYLSEFCAKEIRIRQSLLFKMQLAKALSRI